jgi:hypothetical protein
MTEETGLLAMNVDSGVPERLWRIASRRNSAFNQDQHAKAFTDRGPGEVAIRLVSDVVYIGTSRHFAAPGNAVAFGAKRALSHAHTAGCT